MSESSESRDIIIARIDERFKSLSGSMDELKVEVSRIEEKMNTHLVTRVEFMPIRNAVYGLGGAILLTIFTAIINFVLKEGS